MKVDHYSFGEIIVNGKRYSNDLILFKNKIKSWWRKEGHRVQLDDLKEVIKEKPSILIIGTGAYGVMKVDEEVRNFLKEKKIKLVETKSKEACELYNKLSNKNVSLAIHLTC